MDVRSNSVACSSGELLEEQVGDQKIGSGMPQVPMFLSLPIWR